MRQTKSPPEAGDLGGLVILHPDGTETRSGSYRDDAIRAADAELRGALDDLEWATLRHVSLLRDSEDADDDLDVMESRCCLLELEAKVGRALVAVRRLRLGGA